VVPEVNSLFQRPNPEPHILQGKLNDANNSHDDVPNLIEILLSVVCKNGGNGAYFLHY
jgi:hypothetical protein